MLELLQSIGLTPSQAQILEFLYQNGPTRAREIAQKTNRPREAAYKILAELENLELVFRLDKKGKVARFSAQHPAQIQKILDQKEQEFKQQKSAFLEMAPNLASLYNLGLNRPGIRFLEGSEGLEKVLEDTLRSDTEILTLIDSAAIFRTTDPKLAKNNEKINARYTQKRARLGLQKRIIDLDEPGIIEEYRTAPANYQAITQVRFIKKSALNFSASIQIYHNKISYQAIGSSGLISIIIEDPQIYALQRTQFEQLWKTLPA